MNVKGKIKDIMPMKNVSANFQTREFVVTTDEQYPQDILIQMTNDKCDLLDTYQIGTEVDVEINLRGREWINPQGEKKYFNTIQGWRIARVQPAYETAQTPPAPGQQISMPVNQATTNQPEFNDADEIF